MKENFQIITKKFFRLEKISLYLRRLFKIELLPKAEQFASDSRLSLEDCFEILYYQPFRYKFRGVEIKLHFIPFVQEMIGFPGYSLESHVKDLGTCRIKAKVLNHEWGNNFPGIIQISEVTMLENSSEKLIDPAAITQILIFNRNYLGFFSENQIIEVSGSLQEVNNVSSFNSHNLITTTQIIVGTSQSDHNWEYIRIFHERGT